MGTRTADLTIGKVARDAGLAIDTVRYYEREGLIVINIESMHCEGCAETIKALLDIEAGVRASSVSFKDGRARVLYDPAAADEAKLVAAVERGGYKVTSTA